MPIRKRGAEKKSLLVPSSYSCTHVFPSDPMNSHPPQRTLRTTAHLSPEHSNPFQYISHVSALFSRNAPWLSITTWHPEWVYKHYPCPLPKTRIFSLRPQPPSTPIIPLTNCLSLQTLSTSYLGSFFCLSDRGSSFSIFKIDFLLYWDRGCCEGKFSIKQIQHECVHVT